MYFYQLNMALKRVLKEYEAAAVWLTIFSAIIGGTAFISTIDHRSKTNEKVNSEIKAEVDVIKLEVNQIHSIDQRTVDMQSDLKMIKEHLIKNGD